MKYPRRFRKIPVEVEAIRFNGDNFEWIHRFCGTHRDSGNQWDISTFNPIGTYLQGAELQDLDPKYVGELWVAANSSWLPIKIGEWILKDRLGFYPCDDEVFNQNYNPAVPTVAGTKKGSW